MPIDREWKDENGRHMIEGSVTPEEFNRPLPGPNADWWEKVRPAAATSYNGIPLVDLRFDVTTIGDEVDIVVTHLPTGHTTRGHVKGGPVQPLRDRLVADLKAKLGGR